MATGPPTPPPSNRSGTDGAGSASSPRAGTATACGRSLALAYVDRDHTEIGTQVEISVVGRRVLASVIADSPHDPDGLRAGDRRLVAS